MKMKWLPKIHLRTLDWVWINSSDTEAYLLSGEGGFATKITLVFVQLYNDHQFEKKSLRERTNERLIMLPAAGACSPYPQWLQVG